MPEPRVQFSLFRGDAASSLREPPRRAVQELWLRLSRERWSSLVLVPADEGISASALASELADAGGRFRGAPVTAIAAESMDYESVRMLVDLQGRLQPPPADPDALPRQPAGPASITAEGAERIGREAGRMPPSGHVVLALQPVVVEPLGVAIAQAADLVVLCFAMRKTRVKSARRTIDLLGADRIAGALLV